MLLPILLFLAQVVVPGVLSGPDPAQMETAPELGYRPIETGLKLPDGMKMGAPSSVAFDARGHMYLINCKGFAFFTQSSQPIQLPADVETIRAGKIWVPE